MKRFGLPLVLAVSAATTLAGCAADQGAEPVTRPPAGVSVSLAQWRSDEPVHALQIAVRNTTTTPVYFADVQLVTASFETLPPQRADATIRRTERTDLPITYGEANCAPSGLPRLQPATVVARVRTGDEPLRKVVFTVPHPDPLLSRLLREECSAYLVKQAATLSFGPDWKRDGELMRGSLVLTRRGAGTVSVTSVDGTTHYMVTPGVRRRPLVTLEAGARRAEAPIALSPGRCDPHAFAEAKKAFQFPVRASVDGGEERIVIVTPPQDAQDRLIDYALRVCGLRG
ncbi:hypothetical protein ACGF0J_18880 [Nonomuraea sp. NPDC047897]|uniref:hypothetical protein n=1 Tax=Nonomuraea sp. NPDC047897 TaxID=3364346 RepID=UPI003717CBA0